MIHIDSKIGEIFYFMEFSAKFRILLSFQSIKLSLFLFFYSTKKKKISFLIFIFPKFLSNQTHDKKIFFYFLFSFISFCPFSLSIYFSRIQTKPSSVHSLSSPSI